MEKRTIGSYMLVCASLALTACGGGDSSQKPAATSAAAAQPAASAARVADKPAAAPAKAGLQSIGDFFNAWNALYKQNEKVINAYEGMPIMELVTPGTTFIAGVQYDMLNLGKKDGRFEGVLPLAGYNGFVEKTPSKITFGSDRTRDKDGFGQLAKAGDHDVDTGSLDLDQKYYVAENSTERAGKKISRGYNEFKMLADGSMICLVFSGQTLNARGDQETTDSVIYLHNGKNQFDFVVAKGKTGPAFKTLSFADKGDLTKDAALDLFKAAGYALDKSGGIKDGKLVVDK